MRLAFKFIYFFLFGLKRPDNKFLTIFLINGVFLESLLDHLLHRALSSLVTTLLFGLRSRELLRVQEGVYDGTLNVNVHEGRRGDLFLGLLNIL